MERQIRLPRLVAVEQAVLGRAAGQVLRGRNTGGRSLPTRTARHNRAGGNPDTSVSDGGVLLPRHQLSHPSRRAAGAESDRADAETAATGVHSHSGYIASE